MAVSSFTMLDSNGQNWKVTVVPDGGGFATWQLDPVSTVGTTPGISPAGTYSASDAITQCKVFVGNLPATSTQYIACDEIQSIIWKVFPWNWTQNTLTAIPLVNGVQDYSHSQTDLYRFANLRIVDTNTTPNRKIEMFQKNHLGVELVQKGGIDSIRFYSWEGALSKLRIDRAASVPSGSSLQLEGEYQVLPVKITASTFSSVLNLPDIYFDVFEKGVLWKLYQLNNDQRAGSIEVARGQRIYTGQLGIFRDALLAMKEAEDFSDGEDVIYPDSPLGVGRDNGSTILFG